MGEGAPGQFQPHWIEGLREQCAGADEQQMPGRGVGRGVCLDDPPQRFRRAQQTEVDTRLGTGGMKQKVAMVRQELRMQVVARLRADPRRQLRITAVRRDTEQAYTRTWGEQDGPVPVPRAAQRAARRHDPHRPALISTRLSWSSAANATDRLSGDQNGNWAFSVAGNGRAVALSSDRSQSCD